MVTLVNRARMTTPTVGTGTLTLGQPVDAFQSFAAAGVTDGDLVRYVIEDGSAWEIGTGVYGAAGPTLTRAPLQSSAGGAAIALTGQAHVFVAATTEDFEARLARAGGSMTGPLRLEWNGTHAPLSLPNTGTTNPGTLADGDLWHRSSTLYARLGGTIRTLIHNGNPTALASDMPQAEAEAGSANTRRWITAQRLRQAILGWWTTSTDKTKLDGIAAGAEVNAVTSVAGQTGAVTLGRADVGLAAVDNTADSAKSVASAARLVTPRSLTIGATARSFDGSADLAWSLAEIGAGDVPSSRALLAGTGLTSGGSLAADRTLAIANGSVGTAQLAAGERMSTANVLARTANAAYGAVGTYVLAARPGSINTLPGETVAGSALSPYGIFGNGNNGAA
jgi:hypothetical protein